jgi:DNA-directed RNA polymerase, mitochondrial
MTKLMNKLGLYITWITPSGIEIIQKYNMSKKNKISLNLAGKTKTMVIREWIDKIDKNKQNTGIIPNIIHSLDASHLINIINSANEKNIKPIITVHDCFGCHPNNLDNLSHLIKIKFIELYTKENFLEKFHELNINIIKKNNLDILFDNKLNQDYILIKRTKNYIPIVPKLGNLELEQIIHSKYMIT